VKKFPEEQENLRFGLRL